MTASELSLVRTALPTLRAYKSQLDQVRHFSGQVIWPLFIKQESQPPSLALQCQVQSTAEISHTRIAYQVKKIGGMFSWA